MPSLSVPISDFIQIARVRDGKPAIEEVLVEFDAGKLTIRSEWGKRAQDFTVVREFDVSEHPVATGRLFRLDRDAEAVAADPEGNDHYWVLLNGALGHCDCMGNQATERNGRKCKHRAALEWAVEEGAL